MVKKIALDHIHRDSGPLWLQKSVQDQELGSTFGSQGNLEPSHYPGDGYPEPL